jgi:hypothetical protein
MIVRMIFEGDIENFEVAADAAEYLLENPEHKDVVTSQIDGNGKLEISMHAKRLKKSIRVRQVRP